MYTNRPMADGTIITPMNLKVATSMCADLNKRWPHTGAVYQPILLDGDKYKVGLVADSHSGPMIAVTCQESADDRCVANETFGTGLTAEEYIASLAAKANLPVEEFLAQRKAEMASV